MCVDVKLCLILLLAKGLTTGPGGSQGQDFGLLEDGGFAELRRSPAT